jgi:hypothetical protein
VCHPPVCEPGEDYECEANGDLRECKADRTGYQVKETCTSEAHCDANAGACKDAPCMVGDYQCSGAVLQTCRNDRLGWDDGPTCDTADLCSEAQEKCLTPACTAGERKCSGKDLLTCNAGRTDFNVQTCPVLCDQAQAQCAVCVSGAFRCDGGDLYRCDSDGQAEPNLDTCVYGCVASPDGSMGYCNVCVPDEYRCTNNVLEKCANDGSGFAPDTDCTLDGSTCLVDETTHACIPP